MKGRSLFEEVQVYQQLIEMNCLLEKSATLDISTWQWVRSMPGVLSLEIVLSDPAMRRSLRFVRSIFLSRVQDAVENGLAREDNHGRERFSLSAGCLGIQRGSLRILPGHKVNVAQ